MWLITAFIVSALFQSGKWRQRIIDIQKTAKTLMLLKAGEPRWLCAIIWFSNSTKHLKTSNFYVVEITKSSSFVAAAAADFIISSSAKQKEMQKAKEPYIPNSWESRYICSLGYKTRWTDFKFAWIVCKVEIRKIGNFFSHPSLSLPYQIFQDC